ncbi:MAG: protein kinase [Cyanobacteria bacterium P01_F01_bin.143]
MDFSKQEDNPKPRDVTQDFARNVLQHRYHLLKKLSQDDFETVYLAKSQDSSIPTKYLIQQFTPQYTSESQLAAAKHLFNQEASILEKLGNHPQMVSMYDYFETQGQFLVVQEFISGQSFQAELKEAKPYSEKEIIEFLNEILPVINYLHENNYIHRDIKPTSLIRNSVDQKIYLTNFDSIKEKINPQNLDTTGQFMPHISVGTRGYMPMEQHLGKPEFCSDIYALGIVVIQALTKIELSQLKYDKNNNPVWHHLLPNSGSFSSQFLEIIDTMVCCNYRKRYQSAIAITTSLKHLQPAQKSIHNDLNLEDDTYFSEQTIIQQRTQPDSQFSENTQIINNTNNAPTASEHTLIINNSESNSRTENTLIIKDHDIESTRIINSSSIRNHPKNSQQDHNKSIFKLIAVFGMAIIITIISILLILRNNQNSAPNNSLLLPEYIQAGS